MIFHDSIRSDDGNIRFPICAKNPLIVLKKVYRDGYELDYIKSYTLSSKDVAEDFINDTIVWETSWTLIGTWSGEWSTDTFVLDINEIRDRVITYGRSKWKTFKF